MKDFRDGKHTLDRRGFLAAGAGGLGALALSGSPLWTGGALAASPAAHFPDHMPAQVAPPDFLGTPQGSSPGYLTFPKNLVRSVKEIPVKSGKPVTSMALLGNAPLPTPVDKNVGWQQLNKALGADLQLNMVAQADYGAKWGAVTASGDLPDLMFISIVPVLPNIAAFVNSACANLSSVLGGAAIKDFPNLANIPTTSWNAGMIDGQLWGVPSTRALGGWPMYVQTSLLEKLGMAGAFPKSADDFKAFCKALTDPSKGRWAFGSTNDTTAGPASMTWFQGLFRAPNNWRLQSGGTLVKDIETEEYKAALAYLRELIELGYMAPDLKSNIQLNDDLFGGHIAMRANAWNAYQALYVDTAASLHQTYRVMPPFGHDGKPGTNMLGPGNFGFTVIKKQSPDRVRELLGVLNYLASPFGSEEFLVTKYGVKGVDWNLDSTGTPKLTSAGASDLSGSPGTAWDRLCSPPHYLFSTAVPQYAQFGTEDEALLLAAGVNDPTLGHYSPTDAKTGAQLTRLIFDRVLGIAVGRQPLSDLDQLVKDWKAQGGDQIRAEYEKGIGA